jgi:hypothetical protein
MFRRAEEQLRLPAPPPRKVLQERRQAFRDDQHGRDEALIREYEDKLNQIQEDFMEFQAEREAMLKELELKDLEIEQLRAELRAARGRG